VKNLVLTPVHSCLLLKTKAEKLISANKGFEDAVTHEQTSSQTTY
jgi:hypothetical protein